MQLDHDLRLGYNIFRG